RVYVVRRAAVRGRRVESGDVREQPMVSSAAPAPADPLVLPGRRRRRGPVRGAARAADRGRAGLDAFRYLPARLRNADAGGEGPVRGLGRALSAQLAGRN